jgi:hypothetical protein
LLGKNQLNTFVSLWDYVKVYGLFVVLWLLMQLLEMFKRKHWKNINQAIQKWYEIEMFPRIISNRLFRFFFRIQLVLFICSYLIRYLVHRKKPSGFGGPYVHLLNNTI